MKQFSKEGDSWQQIINRPVMAAECMLTISSNFKTKAAEVKGTRKVQ